MIQVRQGDQYPLQFKVTDSAGVVITNDLSVISSIAITVGNDTKKWSSTVQQLTYNTLTQCWQYPLTQATTLGLKKGWINALIRVKFANSEIVSTAVEPMEILESIDRSKL